MTDEPTFPHADDDRRTEPVAEEENPFPPTHGEQHRVLPDGGHVTDATGPDAADPEEEKPFPPTYGVGGLSDANREWLEEHGHDLDHLVTLERLRRENPGEFALLASAVRDDNRRPVVAAVVHHGGSATYDDIEAYTSCTRRTVRNHAYHLRDNGVLELENSRVTVASFKTETLAVLAEDILSHFYEL